MEEGVGVGFGFFDGVYVKVGVELVVIVKEVWNRELVVKVKEFFFEEYEYLILFKLLFIYFYLVVECIFIEVLIKFGIMAIVYEMVELVDG